VVRSSGRWADGTPRGDGTGVGTWIMRKWVVLYCALWHTLDMETVMGKQWVVVVVVLLLLLCLYWPLGKSGHKCYSAFFVTLPTHVLS